MNRLERLRKSIDAILWKQHDKDELRAGFIHLYSVSAVCAMLAEKRRLDSETAATAGMLHDIWSYDTSNSAHHAELGAEEAEKMLRESGEYSDEEISAITTAIAHHSNKQDIDDDLSELLKDADVLQHHFYNPGYPVHETHKIRLNKLKRELF